MINQLNSEILLAEKKHSEISSIYFKKRLVDIRKSQTISEGKAISDASREHKNYTESKCCVEFLRRRFSIMLADLQCKHTVDTA